MKFAVVILALVAAASAQFNNPFSDGRYNNRYNNPFNNQYNQYNRYNNYNRNRYNNYTPFQFSTTAAPSPAVASVTPAPFGVVPLAEAPVPVAARVYDNYAPNAEILKFANENGPDGSYNYYYETSNGIAAQEQGIPRNFGGNPPVAPIVAQGSFSWVAPEGKTIAISYVADENGYQPSGDAIPTPPAIPEAILRSLEFIARNAPVKK